MHRFKKYQKVLTLSMGALLLGGPIVQNSLPVWAATADTSAGSEETTSLVDQLNQNIAQAKAKVAGATEPTPDLTGGNGHVPSLANLEDAITVASAIDKTDDSVVQYNISKLQDKMKDFDSDYATDIASYTTASTAWNDLEKQLASQAQTNTLTAFKDGVVGEIKNVWNIDYSGTVGNSQTFQSSMDNIVSLTDMLSPVFNADADLKTALDAGQKIMDSGQYTSDQLKTLQQAMADAATNVTDQDWSDLNATLSDYQGVADTATKAINAAIDALPKITPTTPSQPTTSVASHQAIANLQQLTAKVAPNVPITASQALKTALVAAETAIAKKGVGYQDNDISVLNYALNKAYNQYLDTLKTPLNGVGQVDTQGQGVILYDHPAGDPVLAKDGKTRMLPDQSAWKVFSEIQLVDGSTWYNVGKHQWVNANYILLEKMQIVTASVEVGTRVWALHQKTFTDTSRTLTQASKWQSFGHMSVQGEIYYNLGANQWVNSKDVTLE